MSHSVLVETAKRKKIPYQLSAAPGATGTDANAMQLSRGGVATALVEIPLRYMHTPVELVNLKDIRRTALLLSEFITRLDVDYMDNLTLDDIS